MNDSIVEHWKRIEAWLALHAPEVVSDLAPPAPKVALSVLSGHPMATSSMGALCELLALRDGQYSRYQKSVFPGGICLASVADIVHVLDVQAQAERNYGGWDDWSWQDVQAAIKDGRLSCRGPIDPRCSNSWLPFASLNGGDIQLAIDDSGEGGGIPGQVVLFDLELAQYYWVGRSLSGFLCEYADALQARAYTLVDSNIEPSDGSDHTATLFAVLPSVARLM